MKRSNIAIYSALAANIAIAATKYFAARVTHSSAMMAESIHSLVDSVNELLLLYGIYRSNKERDKEHPFGYGRELYFWSFIVSILIFSFGACVSFFQGYLHLKSPAISGKLTWNYLVLAFSLIFEGSSFIIAYRAFKKTAGESLWASIKRSKDPADFMVLFEDGAAVLGILVVFVFLFVGQQTNNPYLDGAASVAVGLILAISSMLLARESRSLLIGEGISSLTEKQIVDMIKDENHGIAVRRLFSLYQSADEVLLVLILSFGAELTTAEISDCITFIKEQIRQRYPKISYIVIQPE
jgi:cation diffusion facilitator family transporter